MVSCAYSTSKYACVTRTIRSSCACANCASDCATDSLPCWYCCQLAQRKSGCVRLTVYVRVLYVDVIPPNGCGSLTCRLRRCRAPVAPICGSSSDRPCGSFSLPASSALRAVANCASLAAASRYVCTRSAAKARGANARRASGRIERKRIGSVSGERRVDLLGPRGDAAREVAHVAGAARDEPRGHLHAAGAVMADADHRPFRTVRARCRVR